MTARRRVMSPFIFGPHFAFLQMIRQPLRIAATLRKMMTV